MWKSVITLAAIAALTACSDSGDSATAPTGNENPVETSPPATPEPEAPAGSASVGPEDGELPLPEGYNGWPVFLSGIEKAATKQIRDIYINPVAAEATGAPMPDGSVFVMEIYAAQTDDAGEAALDADGNMQKGPLSKIFVMAKDEGWAQGATPPNGEWVYAAFEPSGEAAQVNYAECRGCHLAPPATAENDFVARLDEYLASR